MPPPFPPHGNTKGYQIYIHHVHIADGFTDDCEELIHRWLKTETLTYETFCEIWKDLQFNFLYHGRTSGAEMAELSEELLQIAKHYMVSNTDNFEGPVQYHVANRERGMESSIRKYLEGTTGIDRLGVRPKGVFFRQNEESDLLRELNSITKRYVEAKKAIGGGSNLGLNYTNEKLATELDSSLKEIINGIIDDGPEATQKMQDHYSKVQEIKAKAMRQAVDGVRHLVSSTDRPSTSLKPITEGATTCRKRRLKQSLAAGPSKRSRASSTSDSDDLTLSSDDSQDSHNATSRRVEFAPGLNLEAFDKETDVPAIGEEEREINIHIESLPIVITTEESGKMYEIEVIDRMEPKVTKEDTEDAQTKLEKLTEVSLEKVEPEQGTSSQEGEADSAAAPQRRLKRREKRELKKTALRLKFKRMGMLPMANFNDSRKKSPRE